MKTSLIVIALALLAGLVVIASRPDRSATQAGASDPEPSRGPSFEVRVEFSRWGLPLFGILPDALVTQLGGTPSELGFDDTSRGAEVGSVGPDRIELLDAEGWHLSIEADAEGHIAPATRLTFPLGLGGTRMKLRCRPAEGSSGYLRSAPGAGAGKLGGRFLLRLATCENTESGQDIGWPPAPLTVSGTFAELPQGRR